MLVESPVRKASGLGAVNVCRDAHTQLLHERDPVVHAAVQRLQMAQAGA